MPLKLQDLAGRRTALLGYGREGRSLLAALSQRYPDARVTVLAEHPPEIFPDACELQVGPFGRQLLEYDAVVRSPGVPVRHPALAAARAAGVEMVTGTDLWRAERPDARVLAVTGSKGKSTTAALITHLINASGRRAILAGNIGVPVLEHLDTEADWFVLELSSYQLDDLQARMDIGVITRLFPEHLDWHGGREAYYGAKLRLLELLPGRPLVINAADPVLERATRVHPGRIAANRPPEPCATDDGVRFGGAVLVTPEMTRLPGRHNLDNIATALTACRVIGLAAQELAGHLAGFVPLAHRLEILGAGDERTWINDSIATTPEATLAALRTLAGRRITLIAGGLEREADWSAVWEWLEQRPLEALITLPDNGDRIAAEARSAGKVAETVEIAGGLEAAVARARSLSAAGGVILLSPGAPSFPHFRDFEDRGRRFQDLAGRNGDDPG